MKYNFIPFLVQFFTTNCICIYRRLFYKKRQNETEIFNILRDNTFSNSLIRIEYFFDSLIWIKFPKIGRKLFNGTITLNSDKLTFPYEITVRTKRGVKKYIVQKEEVQYSLHSYYFNIKEFKTFKRAFQNPNALIFPKLTLQNPIFYQSPKFYFQRHETKITRGIKINKINHSNFKRTDFL